MKWLAQLMRRGGQESALDKELKFHIEERVSDLEKSGLTQEDARRQVRQEFGGIDQVKEECRDARSFSRIEHLFQDLRYAFRSLSKKPGFVITAVCTLALGIGANTAIFSLISGVLLRPLPFSDPGRLVQLNEVDARNGLGPVWYSDLEEWRRQSASFDGMIAYGSIGKDLQSVDDPERISAVRAERGLFQLLGAQALTGRTFREDDPPDVTVISAGLWIRRFGSDPSVVGRKIILGGEPFTVIGVMSEGFQFPYRASLTELWIPWTLPQAGRLDAIGRLKPGVTMTASRTELSVIAKRLADQHPDTNKGRDASITPLSEVIIGSVRPALLTLLGAVGVVLLIACANVMNLLLARAAGRTHELALRVALGASRGRLMQQLLTESVLMSAAGGAAGLLLAFLSKGLLLQLAASRIPRSWEIGFDWRVFSFLLVVGLGAGIFFGFLPALAASRLDVQKGLTGNRSVGYGSSGWSGRRLRDGLIIAEVAMAFMLVVGAGLLLRAFVKLQNTPTGFVPENVLTLHLSISTTDRGARIPRGRYLDEMENRLGQIPGVQSAGFIQYLPLQNWGWTAFFSIPGRPPNVPGQEPRAELRYVSPGYFNALGVPIRRGRPFNARDTSDSKRVILINEALALRYFPNEDPIGRTTDRGTIIGVVGDVRQAALDRPATPEIYYSFAQNSAATSDAGLSLVVRARTRPEALVNAVRSVIHDVNPDQAVFNVKTMTQVIAESLGDLNLYLWLIGLFAALAMLLAIAGIYGVISFAVTGRTQEFAIRLALGAGRSQILNLVLSHGSRLLAVGMAFGVAGALVLTRTLKSLVSSVTSADPITLVAVGVLIAAVGLAACVIPARRAMRVDPNMALKYE